MVRNYNGDEMETITVSQLIELLQTQDPDAQVIFSTNYGDYARTEQALPIRGRFEEAMIEKSAYSNSGFAIAENDDDYADDAEIEQPKFLVIR